MRHITCSALLSFACVATMPGATVVGVQSGGIVINLVNTATAGTQVAPWTINETMTSTGTLIMSDTDGIPLQSPSTIPNFTSGNWFTKTVINNSGVAWSSFELELEEVLGTPSGEGDGLSFAQGAGLVFSSNMFATVTRIDITRDYLNFHDGNVPNGGSVTFTFAVTDNSPISPIFLLQTPNKADAPEPSTFILLGCGAALVVISKMRVAHRRHGSDQ